MPDPALLPSTRASEIEAPALATAAPSPRVDQASTPTPPEAASRRSPEPSVPAALDIKLEKLADTIRELLPLMRADWEENGVDRELGFSPDFDRYLSLDLRGFLTVCTARDEGLLVGFIFCTVNEHIDHTGFLWALITWYYVHPAYRRQGVGRRILDFLEAFLKDNGVKVIEASEKVAKRHDLFKDYKETDVVSRKLL